jgi:hypothetical protein
MVNPKAQLSKDRRTEAARAVHADAKPRHRVTKPTIEPGVTVWDRDSPNPDIGWHTENGMRVCRHDCDNPEIPGSGARCRDVNVMGMKMHECVTGSSL